MPRSVCRMHLLSVSAKQDNAVVALRSYVYVSKTKVDALYEQIPKKQLKSLAKKLTIDLKIIKAEFGADNRETSLIAKLQIVERYLDQEDDVRDVDAAGADEEVAFFRGRLPLTWAGAGLVFFSGRTDTTVLVMGGSARHLISAPPDRLGNGAKSGTPDLIAGMRWHVFREEVLVEDPSGQPQDHPGLVDASGQAVPAGTAGLRSDQLALLVAGTYAQLRADVPETTMGFLAVPMAIGSLDLAGQETLRRGDKELLRGATRALLASPLYVCLKG